jgi:hypothetical protein
VTTDREGPRPFNNSFQPGVSPGSLTALPASLRRACFLGILNLLFLAFSTCFLAWACASVSALVGRPTTPIPKFQIVRVNSRCHTQHVGLAVGPGDERRAALLIAHSSSTRPTRLTGVRGFGPLGIETIPRTWGIPLLSR